MQKTATPPLNLQALEQLCQQQLQERFPQMAPLQARCYLREETLVVLVEHHPPVLAYPHQAFRLFEQLLGESQPTEECTGLMYLRMQGQQQPYAFHIAKVRPDRAAPVPDLMEESLEKLPLSVAEDAPETEDFDPDWSQTERSGLSRKWLPLVMAGTGLSALVFCVSLYVLSRPCVLGPCREIPVARELAEASLDTLQAPPSGQAIFAARSQLDRAVGILRSIPPWSGHRGEAQRWLARYEKTAAELDILVEGLQRGARAGNATQNPPLPTERWEQAQTLWRDAIASLSSLDPQSEFSDFAAEKVRSYRRNERVVARALETEQEARGHLEAAREMVKTAEVRYSLAESLEDLRLVEKMWEQVTSRLREIPKFTTSYPEAREMLRLYLPQVATARDRISQEVFARNTYDRAVSLAEKAKAAEAANQLSEAVNHWRNALETIKQVPEKTFDGVRAKTLTKNYTDASNRVEIQLKKTLKLQQARSDLAQLCTKTTRVCNFTLDDKGISVVLTPTYVQQVRSSATNAQSKGDLKTQVQLLDHVYTLERALNTISDNAGLPLAVYTHNNVLVQSHVPEAVNSKKQ
ncbi:MAG: hypothetical protein SW833_11855 [Cyanobacteriota bacterium]|nr:hypothetical protein [Cyanobacteriota bacterium]